MKGAANMKKQQTRNKLTRITIALFLVLSMIGNILILPATAQESLAPTNETVLSETLTQDGEEASSSGLSASNLAEGPNSLSPSDDFLPLEEDESLRDTFTKHYVDPDGYRYAVIYPEQVHYHENGAWVEVDNTLTYDSVAKKYVSANNKFITKFSENALSDQLVTIVDGDYALSWTVSFVDGQTIGASPIPSVSTKAATDLSPYISSAIGTVTNYRKPENETTHTGNVSNIGKAASAIRYNNVFNNSVDLRYSVLHGKVEEDIILNSPDNFTSYILTVNTNGLVATKQADNSIWFVNDKKETVFTLAAPWMKDSAVAVSNDIAVSVVQKGEYAYIAYTPNTQWLNDESRVYPVLIDPSFTTRYYTNNYEDTYVYEGDSASSTRPAETMMTIGNVGGNSYCAYIKIINIPAHIDLSKIEDAYFDFYVYTSDSVPLNVYEVQGNWSADTITYATQPSIRSDAIASNLYGSVVTTDSRYTVDLTEWMQNICKNIEWLDMVNFFSSNSWNGFKIECADENEDYYYQIYSSEHNITLYRPVMTIKYSSDSQDYLEDGAVIEIANALNGMRMTVHNGGNSNGTNIYQSDLDYDNPIIQAFKLNYDIVDEAFRIEALCSPGSVLDFDYGGTLNSTLTGYSYSNVKLYTSSDSRAYNQEWLIIPNGTDPYSQTYRIVSRADPNLALTWCGMESGTANGTTATSEGNIYVSEYTGSYNQRWWILSGGSFLLRGTNIETVANSVYEYSENSSPINFTCPVNNFGDTVEWFYSNPYSATIEWNGQVNCHKAGKSTIAAIVTHADGNVSSYEVTIYTALAEGVYYFHNVNNNYRLEYEGMYSVNDGDKLIARDYGSNQIEPISSERYAMFKIEYIGIGMYVIRSMLRSKLSLSQYTSDGDNLSSRKTVLNSELAGNASRWKIETDNNGYYIYNLNTRKAITSPSASSSLITMSTYDANEEKQHWSIYPTTANYNGTDIVDSITYLAVGDTYQFVANIYSSFPHDNGQNGFVWSIVDGFSYATIDANTGILTGISSGNVTITATYSHDSSNTWSTSCEVEIIPFADGEYWIRNDGSTKYMQPNSENQTYIECHEYNWYGAQKWELEYQGDQYYTIKNVSKGWYLTAPASETEGASILQYISSNYLQERQLWKFELLPSGRYKIQAKAHDGTALSLAISISSSGEVTVVHKSYTNDDDYCDEWNIAGFGEDVFLLGIQDSNPDENHDHVVSFHNSVPYFIDLGYYDINIVDTDHISASNVLECMQSCKIFVSRSHGAATGTRSMIYIDDNDSSVTISSFDIYDYTNNRPMVDLSNCEIMLFVGCSTGTPEAKSLPDAAVAAGADVAVGFTVEIGCDSANAWVETFFSRLSKGDTIDEAITLALEDSDMSWEDINKVS